MNSKRALVIINPCAGTRKSKKNMFEIVDRLSNSGYQVSVQTTTKSGDGAAFVHQYGAEHQLIVCSGGDGTLNEVINGMLELQLEVPLGYVPSGTTNDFARTLQLPAKVEKCMDRILRSSPRAFDIGSFNGRNFTYIASLGAFTKVSYSTPQKFKNIFGHSAYLLEGAKEIGSITPFEAEILVNGKSYAGEFLFGSVSNSTSIAGLFKLNGLDVRLDDGEFELILIRNPKSVTDLHGIVQGLTRGIYDPRYVIFEHTKAVTVKTAIPCSWTIDGEDGGAHTEAQIGVIPNAVNIII